MTGRRDSVDYGIDGTATSLFYTLRAEKSARALSMDVDEHKEEEQRKTRARSLSHPSNTRPETLSPINTAGKSNTQDCSSSTPLADKGTLDNVALKQLQTQMEELQCAQSDLNHMLNSIYKKIVKES